MANNALKLPGRLGDPNMCLGTDPRLHPGILATLKPLGMDQLYPFELPELSIAKTTRVIKASEDNMIALYEGMDNSLPGDANEPKILATSTTIKGVDDNDIILYIFKPASATDKKPLPCIVYTHGGGMVVGSTSNKVHNRWCTSLAVEDTIVIMTDFRNAYTAQGHNPFPAGLNDCTAAVKYVSTHKSEFGISTITLQGESGGGNLAIATALKVKREGWISGAIDGVYAVVPFISNGYLWSRERKLAELPSLVENDGYWLEVTMMGVTGFYYSPDHLEDPHAWPYHSSIDDLKGLPPVMLSMDELDPLRDEGMAFHRKLLAAGVKTTATVSLGTIHASALALRKAAPEHHYAMARSVAAFAKSECDTPDRRSRCILQLNMYAGTDSCVR
jgi:acetyl esterase/lipase